MEEALTSPPPLDKKSQAEQEPARLSSSNASSNTAVIEQLQESNRKLEQSLKELQERLQSLIDSSNNTEYLEKPVNEVPLAGLAQLSSQSHFISEIESRIHNSSRYTIISTLIVIHVNSIFDPESEFGMFRINLILKKIQHYLQNTVMKPFTAARLDDHLFALLLDDCSSQESVEVATFIKKIIYRYLCSNAYAVSTENSAPCTIGLAPVNANAINAEDLLFQTEVKPISTLKIKNLANILTKSASMRTSARDMMAYLIFSLNDKDFKLLFQPLVNLKTNDESGYEVLTRMLDSNGLIIPAEEFIPLAHLNDVGEALDKIVIQQALKRVQEHGQAPPLLMITITNNSLLSPTFISWLSKQLQFLNIDPAFLTLQISEIDICNNIEQATEFCKNMDKLGLRKAVCHFACSKSPQDYLDTINPDYIKLDKAILCDIIYKIRQKNQVKDIINDLHHKGYKVMAPQIENINLLPVLWKFGVDFVQGYCLQAPREDMDYPFIQDIAISAPAPQYGVSR